MHNSLAITKKSVDMNIGDVSFYIKYLTLDLKTRVRLKTEVFHLPSKASAIQPTVLLT